MEANARKTLGMKKNVVKNIVDLLSGEVKPKNSYHH